MPTTNSAKKRLRQSEKRRKQNRSLRSEIRTRTKQLLEADSVEAAREQLPDLYRLLDRAAGKDVIHENKAARKKSQIARHVEKLARED